MKLVNPQTGESKDAPCDECVHWMYKCELDGDFRRWCIRNDFVGFTEEPY